MIGEARVDDSGVSLRVSTTSRRPPWSYVAVKQQCLSRMTSQYDEVQPTSGWDLLASLRQPCKFQRVLRLGSVTARQSSSGHQPNFATMNRGRHLYSAGRPSRWALAHISSCHLAYAETPGHYDGFKQHIVQPTLLTAYHRSRIWILRIFSFLKFNEF